MILVKRVRGFEAKGSLEAGFGNAVGICQDEAVRSAPGKGLGPDRSSEGCVSREFQWDGAR